MITTTTYESYFEDLATDFKPISHSEQKKRFVMMDIDDIISAQRGILDFSEPCLILENPEGKLRYKNDKVLDENYGAFLILMQVNRDDPAQKRAVMNLTKQIGMAIIGRLQQQKIERSKGDLTIPRMILYFNLSDVNYQKVSNVFSGAHGWRFEFNLGQEDPVSYNAEDWYSKD